MGVVDMRKAVQKTGSELTRIENEIANKALDPKITQDELNELKNKKQVLQEKFDTERESYDKAYNEMVSKLELQQTGGNPINNDLILETSDGKKIKALRKGDSFKASLKTNNKENLSLGRYIKGALTGTWKGAEHEMDRFKALSTGTGQILIPQELSGNIIDFARNSIALDDVLVVPMESNNLTIAKITKDPDVNFKEELAEASFSDTTFEGVTLKSRTAYGLIKISLELLQSAANIEAVMTQALGNAVAAMIDKNGLYGTGGIAPTGIATLSTINKINADPIATSHYNGFVQAIGAITGANGIPTDIAYNSKIDTSLNLLTDTTGQPLNAPKAVQNLASKVSNQVSDNQAIVYDKDAILMGIQSSISLEVSREMGFKDGSVWIRVYSMLDFAALKDKNISLINFAAAS